MSNPMNLTLNAGRLDEQYPSLSTDKAGRIHILSEEDTQSTVKLCDTANRFVENVSQLEHESNIIYEVLLPNTELIERNKRRELSSTIEKQIQEESFETSYLQLATNLADKKAELQREKEMLASLQKMVEDRIKLKDNLSGIL